MIKTKEDLKYYIEQDWLALFEPKKKDEIFVYEKTLRYHEYYLNKEKKNLFDKMMLRHYQRKHHRLSVRYTTSINVNTVGPGLSIAHFGAIYFNHKAKAGKNLRIQSGVTVGGVADEAELPVLGDNVYLGSGSKVIGPVHVADNVAIGANAVVCKSIEEHDTTWAGVPARKVSENNSWVYISKKLSK